MFWSTEKFEELVGLLKSLNERIDAESKRTDALMGKLSAVDSLYAKSANLSLVRTKELFDRVEKAEALIRGLIAREEDRVIGDPDVEKVRKDVDLLKSRVGMIERRSWRPATAAGLRQRLSTALVDLADRVGK